MSISRCYLITEREGEDILSGLKGGYFCILTNTINEYSYTICKTSYISPQETIHGIEQPPEELDALLYASYRYPPALAYTRENFSKAFPEPFKSKEEFLNSTCILLKKYLEEQKYAPYFLSEVIIEETGYLIKGDYCWIVGYIPEKQIIEWVSFDFFIYKSHISYFNIPDKSFLEKILRYNAPKIF